MLPVQGCRALAFGTVLVLPVVLLSVPGRSTPYYATTSQHSNGNACVTSLPVAPLPRRVYACVSVLPMLFTPRRRPVGVLASIVRPLHCRCMPLRSNRCDTVACLFARGVVHVCAAQFASRTAPVLQCVKPVSTYEPQYDTHCVSAQPTVINRRHTSRAWCCCHSVAMAGLALGMFVWGLRPFQRD